MPKFYFQLLDHEGLQPTMMAFDFEDIEAAAEEGRTALAQMAADGLPGGQYNMLSVEIFDDQQKPVREIRLILEDIDKTNADFATGTISGG